MNRDLAIQIERADELIRDLESEYTRSLNSKTISQKANVLAHEVFEKLSNILDQMAHQIWEKLLSKELPKNNKARIYFPIGSDEENLAELLKTWKVKNLREEHKEIYDFLVSVQPFTTENNKVLKILKDLARKKHIGLIPQKRTEITNVKYSNQYGTVQFISENVKFGPGVSILGAPIGPNTQRVIPTQGVTETVEKWVAFHLEGYDLNVLGFCKETYARVKNLVEEASEKFGL